MLANMLGGAPELERELLPALVNKLGDPEKKVATLLGIVYPLGTLLCLLCLLPFPMPTTTPYQVASRLTHLMHALLLQHPAMKPVLLAEVQRLLIPTITLTLTPAPALTPNP